MFRALHTSGGWVAQRAAMYGQPSWTMSFDAFQEPTFAFRSRNCSGVIEPACSASRPYWTPTLSHGERAKPVSSVP